ncbi:hypothetical protein A4A49_54851 [Nicotiana attenuata]|uniref:VQ domain-containing protein n=1 Tax=Nicotiana attenuata TaxID=49451 RepID=A0A314L9H4_NICAT|nr:hypothetical protein A4A49_64102 [Nicotiana attenuata]OIT38143.1 hypothetical protein A4A49_54851 [Nicotiana attenuata]
MGKKVTAGQASKSHKIISKNNNHIHDNKKQLNNLIKFLKPKVYITNSSNFKNLVQELTGNGSSSPMISSPPPPDHHHDHDQRLQFIDHQYQEYSQELSIDSSKGSIPSSFNTFEASFQEPSFSWLDSNNYSNMGNQDQMDFSEEYRNIETWLLEMDSYTSYHHQYEGHVPFIQEQVSVDDYSSLL